MSGRDAAGLLQWHLTALGIAPVPEYPCVPGRKWRFDLAFPDAMVAIEVHGAVWTRGRHTRGGGFIRDREKMNAAQVAGWTVLEYTTDDLRDRMGYVVDQIAKAIEGGGGDAPPTIKQRG